MKNVYRILDRIRILQIGNHSVILLLVSGQPVVPGNENAGALTKEVDPEL